MAAVGQAQQAGRGGSGHDGNFGQGVFAGDGGERGDLHGVFRQGFDVLGAQGAVHQQGKEVGIGGERGAVRVVGGEEDSPGVVNEQEQFQAGGPLHGVVEVGFAVAVGHDAAAVAVAVHDDGFAGVGLAAGVELAEDVGGDGDGLAEHHLADVGGDVGAGVDGLGEAWGGGGEASGAVLAVGVELQVGDVQSC